MDNAPALAAAADSSDPRTGLRAVAALRRLLEQLEALQVDNAREHGWSWQEIAEILGVSRQAVHKKHARRADVNHPIRRRAPRPLTRGDLPEMFERFTDKARKVVSLALAKAKEHGDDQIRLVHMLYGLAAADGVAASALTALGVDAAAVEREIGRTSSAPPDLMGSRDEAADGDADALAAIGIDLDEIRRKIEESFGPGALERVPPTPRSPLTWSGRLPLNEQAKLALALSLKEARSLHHNYIGTEHVLLGVLRVAEGHPHGDFASVTLPGLRLDPDGLRARVLDELRQLQN